MAFEFDLSQIAAMGADALLVMGAFGAAGYCFVLARRLKRFNNLENGVGGAVAVLSAQVDDMTKTLERARKAAAHSSATLTTLTERAEDSARKLELMMASLHDLPDEPSEATETEQDKVWSEAEAEASDAAPLFASKRTTARDDAA